MKCLICTTLLAISSVNVAFACTNSAWHSVVLAGPQRFEIRDSLKGEDGTDIFGIRFGPMAGPYPKIYLFIEYDGSCPVQAVSLMRHDPLPAPTEGVPPGTYNLTHYTAESETILQEFQLAPRYEYVKTRALQAMSE